MIGSYADSVYSRMLENRPEIDPEEFAAWFNKRRMLFEAKDVEWEKEMDYSSFHSHIGDCHANALLNAIEGKLGLYSGLMAQPQRRGGTWEEPHSFNMRNGKIVDPTVYCNQDKFYGCTFPFEYVGIEIPETLIHTVNQEYLLPAIKTGRERELSYLGMLVPYFLESTGRDWRYLFNPQHTD